MRLEDWLAENERTAAWLSRKMGVPPSTVARIIKGRRAPTHAVMEKIIGATGGGVLPNDFFDLSRVAGSEK